MGADDLIVARNLVGLDARTWSWWLYADAYYLGILEKLGEHRASAGEWGRDCMLMIHQLPMYREEKGGARR